MNCRKIVVPCSCILNREGSTSSSDNGRPKLVRQISNESRTSPQDFLPRTFSSDFDEKSCVNRSWADEISFYELGAGLVKEFFLTRSWVRVFQNKGQK